MTIPNSVTSIGDYAFYDCTGLTSVTIGNSVTSIGNCMRFHGCSGLTSVTIGTALRALGCAFYCCTGLTSVTIPDSVTSIGDAAFYGCSGLTNAYFFGNAPSMGADVFYDCASNFTVCYTAGSTGFTNPWYGYPAYPCAVTTTTSVPTTTTTVQPTTTTTTIPEEECSVVKVQSTILPLNAGCCHMCGRIVITGENSNWDRTTAVSIEGIKIVIPLLVQPTKIIALIVIPSTFLGFIPGEKEVGVATGSEFCTGTVEIP